MQKMRFEDVIIGFKESFSITITSEMMEYFKLITGDINPLHCDYDYAKSSGYKDCVVYGMLCSSFYSTLAGMYLPGKYCLLRSVDTSFKNPVFVNDRLVITGEVIEKDERFKQLTIKGKTVNQDGITVNRGIIKAGFINEG